jgi:hypothetical protein
MGSLFARGLANGEIAKMMIKASGRSALILAAGLFVGFAAPSLAAAGADNAAATSKSETAGAPVALGKYAKHGSRHLKKYAHRKSGKVAAKSATDDKADAPDVAAGDGDPSSAIPPSVANANAQLTSADTPTGKAQAMSARANDILQAAPDKPADAQPAADSQVVSADQLNDLDRALHESTQPASTPPAATLAMASADAPATPLAPVAASSNESSTWDHTSLIGKIFIGFGALLTMASAARMFMA